MGRCVWGSLISLRTQLGEQWGVLGCPALGNLAGLGLVLDKHPEELCPDRNSAYYVS